jgi:Flp pilus assembly protein TadB
VPFTQRFDRTTEIQRDIYFVTLILAALSTVLLIAPSSQHRLLFRKKDKEQLLLRSNMYAIAGFICLGAALSSAVLFVAAFLFSSLVAVLATAVLGALLVWLWIALPLRRRFVEKDD